MRSRVCISWAAVLVVLVGCAFERGNAQWPSIGRVATIDGVVMSYDRDPWMVDGDGIMVVDSSAHGRVTVLVPARINLCQARGMDVATSAEPGDRLRVTGEVVGHARISACRSTEHEVARLDP